MNFALRAETVFATAEKVNLLQTKNSKNDNMTHTFMSHTET